MSSRRKCTDTIDGNTSPRPSKKRMTSNEWQDELADNMCCRTDQGGEVADVLMSKDRDRTENSLTKSTLDTTSADEGANTHRRSQFDTSGAESVTMSWDESPKPQRQTRRIDGRKSHEYTSDAEREEKSYWSTVTSTDTDTTSIKNPIIKPIYSGSPKPQRPKKTDGAQNLSEVSNTTTKDDETDTSYPDHVKYESDSTREVSDFVETNDKSTDTEPANVSPPCVTDHTKFQNSASADESCVKAQCSPSLNSQEEVTLTSNVSDCQRSGLSPTKEGGADLGLCINQESSTSSVLESEKNLLQTGLYTEKECHERHGGTPMSDSAPCEKDEDKGASHHRATPFFLGNRVDNKAETNAVAEECARLGGIEIDEYENYINFLVPEDFKKQLVALFGPIGVDGENVLVSKKAAKIFHHCLKYKATIENIEVKIPGKDIWIVGSSIVYWACQRSLCTFGKSLGLREHGINVFWNGKRGMRWGELITHLTHTQAKYPYSKPSVIVIYLGGNDILSYGKFAQASRMTHDFGVIKRIYPDSEIIWCQIFPRDFKGKLTVDGLDPDKARRDLNEQVSFSLENTDCSVIKFPEITLDKTEFYRDDGIHLTDDGNDEFLATLIASLEIFCLDKGIIKKDDDQHL